MIKRALLLACCTTALAVATTGPAAAAPWVKGYVVGYYGYAFRFGGRQDYAKAHEIDPGVDCPHGSTVSFANPDSMRHMLSLVSWLSPKQVESVAGSFEDQGDGPKMLRRYSGTYRGFRPDIQTYVNPFAADDPGEPEVHSRIGEGFNLDGKVKPADFVSPDGEAGIDNNLYKAWGCDAPWRGDGNATLDLRANDKMQQGLFTIVVRLSGNKDPMNDDAATLEIGLSPDGMLKDGRGNTGQDYSFRLLKGPEYSKLKARIKDGVVETEQTDIHMPQIAWTNNQLRDADFHQGKMRLILNADGTASGLVGGYRDWRDLYVQNTFAQDGAQQGGREHEDMVGLYYALRRNADGLYNTKTGRYDGISSAYRMKLAEAFVVDPAKAVVKPASKGGRYDKGFDQTRAALIKGTETLVVQSVPKDSQEAKQAEYLQEMIGPITPSEDIVDVYRQRFGTDGGQAQQMVRNVLFPGK